MFKVFVFLQEAAQRRTYPIDAVNTFGAQTMIKFMRCALEKWMGWGGKMKRRKNTQSSIRLQADYSGCVNRQL